jgi:predicted GNAT superfamily acetyltransferase
VTVAPPPDATRFLLAVPHDAEALRVADPELAARWRVAVRDVLAGFMADGARVTGFTRDGWYVIDRPTQKENLA